jgi:hypothetical protein
MAVNLLLKNAVEEGVLYVQLMNWPLTRGRQGENSTDRRRLDDG